MTHRFALSIVLAGAICMTLFPYNAAKSEILTEASATTSCRLGAGDAIERVIYIQFDNTHLLRDNANVPSDLGQMPHLLQFIRGNGTLLANDPTVLISHTAGGILSSLTGV